MGESRLQRSSHLFHFSRTSFKLEQLKSSALIGFLTPEKVLILPHPSFPATQGLGVVSRACRALRLRARLSKPSEANSVTEPTAGPQSTSTTWPFLGLDQCGLTWPKSDTPVTRL